jgi:hypothetical protein
MENQITEPISIEEAKLYLRLDSDYEANNLLQIIKTVREAAEQYLRCSLLVKSCYKEIPAPIKQGMLIHLVSLFEARGGEVSMPVATCSLYQPYRKIML